MSGMTECYVAFLDLMGVRALTKKCATDANLHARVIQALQETKDISPFFRESRDIKSGTEMRWCLQVQAFSDSVVLFIPTESKMLSWLLASIQRLHDRLLCLEIPLRGGITIGGMHWDDEWSKEQKTVDASIATVAFGNGLVSAYDLENSVACYPRILLSDKLIDEIYANGVNASAFPLGKGILKDFCRQDSDGIYHLHILHPNITRKDPDSTNEVTSVDGQKWIGHNLKDIPFDRWLTQVGKFVTRGLESVEGEKLQAKYRWLARYYNEVAVETKASHPIPIFEDRIPKGAIPLTVANKPFPQA